MDVLLVRETQFQKTLADMRRKGGVASKAAEEVDRIIGRLTEPGAQPPSAFGQLTRHGETRIPNCVKYQLGSGHRLVCVQTDNAIQLLFVGSHDECDRWLDRNKGLRIAVDAKTKRLTPIYEVKIDGALPQRPPRPVHNAEEALVTKLAEADLAAFGLSAVDYRRIAALTVVSDDDEILAAVGSMSADRARDTILSVLLELREGRVDAARAHIGLFVGTVKLADEEQALLSQAVRAPVNTDAVVNLRELSEIERKHLFSQADFQDWLLFLHPDQKPVAQADFEGPALVRGVSGSGKTCVVVHRAHHLARKYPGERVAVVTLNPALAGLIGELLTALCPPEVRQRIDCLSVAQLCKNIITHFEPLRPVQRVDPRSEETLDDAWTESFQTREQLVRLDPIIESLARVRKLDAERYIRDEFIWIRSAFSQFADVVPGSVLPGRSNYLDPERTPRRGRAIQFSRDWRDRALRSLESYEDFSSTGGLYDPAGLTLLAHRHVGALRKETPDRLKYRAVLVDEVQDLGKVELEILRVLAPVATNGLFLAGDARQQVFPKDHDLSGAGIEVRQRRGFKKNYRNTKQVLEAGVALVKAFGPSDGGDEFEVLDPEFSERESPKPLIVAAENGDRELEFIRHYVQLKRQYDNHPICVVACGLREDDEPRLVALQKQLQAGGLETSLLHRDARVRPGAVFLSALETVKGFEFSLMIVAQCGAVNIPVPSLPEEEAWRDASRLYVAFTRARDELVLTHSGEPSRFLRGIGDTVQWTTVVEQGMAPVPSATSVPLSLSSEAATKPTAAPATVEPKAPVPSPRRVVDSPLRSGPGPRKPPVSPPPAETRTRNDELLAELERLRNENQNLRASTSKGTSIKVGAKGGVSVYGLGRFPVTLYKQQWERLLGAEAEIRQFLLDHEAELATKGDSAANQVGEDADATKK
jgi:AAA domain